MNYYGSRAYATVSIDAIRDNFYLLKNEFKLPLMMSVIKSDGYGHGIEACVDALDAQTDWYAVANFEEAKKIRNCQSSKPILVLGMIPLEHSIEASQLSISCSLISLPYAKALSAYCMENGIQIDCHLALDTGFHRIGFRAEDIEEFKKDVDELYRLPGLQISGVYTHFSSAGSAVQTDMEFTNLQFERYKAACEYIENTIGPINLKHCCNSRAAVDCPEFHLDMVRIGLFLFGLGPDDYIKKIGLIPALEWKAKLVDIKEIEAGDSVGYSRAFIAEKKMKVGIISCGFGDGYFRSLFRCEKPLIIVNGVRCHILGKICMDYMMVEIPEEIDSQNVEVVTLIGKEGSAEVSTNEIAEFVGGTAIEVTSQITSRVHRVHI